MARQFATALLILAIGTTSAQAMPQHKQTLKRYYGTYLDHSLSRCATCHVVPEGMSEEEFESSDAEHNAFGTRLRELGEELSDKDQPADLITRLSQIGDEDADQDGVANDLEIVCGTSPGEASSVPNAEKLATAAAKLDEFRKQYRFDSWKPVSRPPVPEVADASWIIRTPVDAFIAAEHQRQGLVPRGEAPRHVLLRRVYLDLIGLPPTAEELRAFLNDTSPDAYEKVVDSLLDRPQYGERWGRHWMDVWRYSDWAGWGAQVRDSMPHVWRWRDWIIESQNADKPYDCMLLEMLAADELCPEDTSALRATGFLVRNYKRLSREQWMQDAVNHASKAFLATTLECARCHDHMYDPISQEDYYKFRAIFEPYDVRTDRVPGEVNVEKDGLVRAYDANAGTPTYLYVRGDERQPNKDKAIEAGVPPALEGAEFALAEVPLPTLAQMPDKRSFVIEDDLTAAALAAEEARKKLTEAEQRCSAAEQTAAAAGAAPDSQQVLAQARHEVTQLRLDAELADAKRASLLATVHVEQLEEQGAKESDFAAWEQAAKAALVAQRQAALAEKRAAQFAIQDALVKAEAAKADAEGKLAASPEDAALKEAAANASKAFDEVQKNKTAADEAIQAAERDLGSEPTTEYAKRNVTTYPEKSSGRRLALAKWLVNPRNPRTARVAVNQIWMRHIGQPLVPTVFDFGNNGQLPTHPALLDWLAAELMQPSLSLVSTENGRAWRPSESAAAAWSMKHLHRLIVTSSVYRMASTPDADCAALDPDNRYLWRMPPRRMEAELVRDCALYVAGQLDLSQGGPDIDYELGLSVKRRSVYFRHAPEKQMTFLRLFDAASPDECYRRKESIVPQQALALANSSLTLEQSRRIARSLHAQHADSAPFIQAAFECVLSRAPTPDETATCLEFLGQQQALFVSSADRLKEVAASDEDVTRPAPDVNVRVRENLVHVLLNHNDFVTIR